MPYIKGKWKWQKSFEDRDHQAQCQCSFVSNGETFYGIGFGYDSHNGCYMLEYERSEGSATAGSSYQDETTCYMFDDYRIMDFGETEQYIDRMLHEFILDHAEPYFTIPEKLETIASNEQKVHKAGYDLGHDKGYDEGLDVGYQNGFEEGKNAGGYDQGFEDGKDWEYDAFWEMFNAKSHQRYMFDGWDSKLFYPKYDLRPTDAVSYMAGMKTKFDLVERLNECGVILDMSQCTDIAWAFSQCESNKYPVIDATSARDLTGTFYYNIVLESIEKLILKSDGSQTFGYEWGETFRECRNLRDITFDGVIGNDINFQWSTKLTRASIESIVSHLSDTTTGKTLTLSKAAADNAFPCPLEDGNGGWINVGCGGNSEWLELIAPKVENGKWIIDLV